MTTAESRGCLYGHALVGAYCVRSPNAFFYTPYPSTLVTFWRFTIPTTSIR